jgi:hypothetical protein
MNLLDIFDVTSNASNLLDESGKKQTKIQLIFNALLVPTLIWFVFELPFIIALNSPFGFLSLFITANVILSFLTAYVLWRTQVIAYYTKQSFVSLSIVICLFTLSIASFTNRQYRTEIKAKPVSAAQKLL